ncbi:PQQ-binding-like beta-propeller repeat protein [Actinomadura sp. NPDC048394]|uniref:outer membrane protein assembly factor BamB family protein n=1 Tax=Actinomadura sp. NPDC048394 TaxID=3158223 RepID=UPI0033FE0A9E
MDEEKERGDAAAEPVPLRGPKGRWTGRAMSVLGCALAVVVLVGAGVWWFSPWEHMMGLHGAPPKAAGGVPFEGERFFRDVVDPVLAGGALVERHGRGVRAVDLGSGRTWWNLTRPGRATVASVWKVDDRRVAVAWTDRRLTVVDVPSGHRMHVELPDRSAAGGVMGTEKIRVGAGGLSGPGGRLLVAAVQDREVDAYDASSGRRAWRRPAPRGCFYHDALQDGIQSQTRLLSLDVDCLEYGGQAADYAYSTLLDSSGEPLPGFAHFPGGSLLPAGDHELLQDKNDDVKSNGYRLIDSRTGRTLWRVDQWSSSPAGGRDEVTAAAGQVVVTDQEGAQVALYRAADGRLLWRRNLGDSALLRAGMVIAGQVRVIEEEPPPIKVVTFTSTGGIEGEQDLPMFEGAGLPALAGGAYGALVVADTEPEPNGTHRPSVLLTARR